MDPDQAGPSGHLMPSLPLCSPVSSEDEVERDMRVHNSSSESDSESDQESDNEVIVNPSWCNSTAGLRDIPFSK
ncbi:hypothetical protein J6590_107586, partial [Homalodisca vitripennis]